jgi:uncharacterized membrane protein
MMALPWGAITMLAFCIFLIIAIIKLEMFKRIFLILGVGLLISLAAISILRIWFPNLSAYWALGVETALIIAIALKYYLEPDSGT